ncbi:hypothetical protein ACO2Q3_10845 [Caulobacter sp. KR2-114]|uniref:hypothetical protein n=1 Tax=Caulobacter sp. KR2-114 TaxID=3400912 RepID=UPI003C0FFD56
MILGLSVATFTLVHVLISLVGIGAGLVALVAMIAGKDLGGWTATFLATTVATSATGFLFHSKAIGPPHIVGAISLVVLLVALVALYGRHLAGRWRLAYVVTAVLALYFNCFVGVVQAFQKIAFLNALAPKGTEPPFAIAQGLLLVAAIAAGWLAVRNFHPAERGSGAAIRPATV